MRPATRSVGLQAVDVLSGRMAAPAGALAETSSRAQCPMGNQSTLVSGTLAMNAIILPAGITVAQLAFMSANTPANLPTHWWFALFDKNRNLLSQTADQLTAAWAANTAKNLALGASQFISATDLYYLGLLMTATTVITTFGNQSNTNVNTVPPIMSGASTTGLTTTAPNPAAVITPNNSLMWAWVL